MISGDEPKVSIFVKYPVQFVVALPVMALCIGLLVGIYHSSDPVEDVRGSVVTINNNPPVVVDRGCLDDPKLTNDQIILETTKCTAAGLGAEALHCGDNYDTMEIQCTPK